jgi:hypothetical protein
MGFMKYAIDMVSGGMIKTGTGVQAILRFYLDFERMQYWYYC